MVIDVRQERVVYVFDLQILLHPFIVMLSVLVSTHAYGGTLDDNHLNAVNTMANSVSCLEYD